MTHNWTIYMYTFPNGKRYVGATKRPLHLRQGSYESGWVKYKQCRLLWEAIQEFGVDNIKQTILFKGVIEDSEAAEMEKHYIELYKTNANRYTNPSYGYNLGNGGEGTGEKHLSDERKKELAQQMAEQGKRNIGRTVSEITRVRQRAAKIGKKHGPLPEEQRRKIGLSNSLARISPETRRRKSEAFNQPVLAYDPITGKTLYFHSRKETAKYFGVGASSVSRWLLGSRKPTNGYVFRDATREEECV